MPEQPGNQTPNTPDVSETELRAKKVDELRREASKAGVAGSSSMRKDDLVHAVADAREAGQADSGQRSTGGRAADRSGEEPGNQTPNTPDVSETELRGMKVDELRREASGAGVSGTSSMKKDDLVHAVADARSAGTGGEGRESAAGDQEDAGPDGGHLRTGPDTSKSLKYSQEVTSPDEDPERPGRSLATTHHDVIREWAEARNATPATVPGTEHGDHLGVLRLDFGNDDDRLRHVSWDEWFGTFDARRLNFIYQEERTDGHTSTFFRLESPDREDA
jgi:Rho termination factor, N-terminal domain